MFSIEEYGYNKKEVDEYIENLKRQNQRALMEEKIKSLESEKRYIDLKRKNTEIENKEKNILSALESFKQVQEGNKDIQTLQGEQLKKVYIELRTFLQDLDKKYPEILLNKTYQKLNNNIENIINKVSSQPQIIENYSVSDPMRILLNKMQEKRDSEPKEVRIERVANLSQSPSKIKPVTDMKLEKNDKFDTLADKFLNTKPSEEEKPSIEIQSSSFDIKEAISPTEGLDEIMKAFDFYGKEDNKANKSDYHFDD